MTYMTVSEALDLVFDSVQAGVAIAGTVVATAAEDTVGYLKLRSFILSKGYDEEFRNGCVVYRPQTYPEAKVA